MWLLGEGSYGKVWKAVWTRSDGSEADVAMKMTIISPGGRRTAIAADQLFSPHLRKRLKEVLCESHRY